MYSIIYYSTILFENVQIIILMLINVYGNNVQYITCTELVHNKSNIHLPGSDTARGTKQHSNCTYSYHTLARAGPALDVLVTTTSLKGLPTGIESQEKENDKNSRKEWKRMMMPMMRSTAV